MENFVNITMVFCAFGVVTYIMAVLQFYYSLNFFQKRKKIRQIKEKFIETHGKEIMDICHESIWILSSNLIIEVKNKAAGLFFGEMCEGKLVNDFIHCDDLLKFQTALEFVLSNNIITIELNMKSIDTQNQFCLVESTLRVIRTKTNYKFVMVTRLLSELKRNSSQDRLYLEKDVLNESKLKYISCTAHDLKAPLQSFSVALDLLTSTQLNKEQEELVSQAYVSIDLMKLTISQTMDISKALKGTVLKPRKSTVSLSRVLKRVEIIINGYGKQVPITYSIAENVCDSVITDEEWLWQMLLNLLTNACKYTLEGSIKVAVQLSNDAESTTVDASKNSFLVFKVVDTGYLFFFYFFI
jgi:signal transduction histidine kinase